MKVMFLCHKASSVTIVSPLSHNPPKYPLFTCSLFPCILSSPMKNPLPFLSPSSTFRLYCQCNDDEPLSPSLAYDVLGVSPNCNLEEIKSAFRAKVKQFHPDVRHDKGSSDIMIRRVIKAYEILSNYSRSEIIERECLDPFDEPECEALDLFVNEILCIGKGCPYSCVKKAPQAFEFSLRGSAHATSQGNGDDYDVQVTVSQCPRSCIHYVTPCQRLILKELLDSIIDVPYDTSAEIDLLYSLILKARFENNRYQKPKKQPKDSTKHVDWF
ncbi:hypothetical protein M9H77_27634 [Catharanthus roseus]|uniref:Uncharacterized protein n=1 Tax=Catharanthus roseus TaxID=4058 RepID=A0ACC0ADM3_CATRO|nr:hypothetical protein M9H77_27634 [Catharanthus roseus]